MTETARRPWKALTLLAAVFLTGAVVGGAVVEWEPWEHDHGRNANGLIAHLTEELDLTQAQQDSISAVLERWRPQMDSAWAEVRPRIETVRANIRSDIASHLTESQRAAYEEMVNKRHREPPQGSPPPRSN